MLYSYNFEDGKYRVERDDEHYSSVKIYRGGDRWLEMEEEMRYSKFFHSMINKIDELENTP